MATDIKTKVLTFDFDQIEEVVEQLFDESGETQNAIITYEDGTITLTTVRIRDCDIQVYRSKETKEVYEQMDAKYIEILEDRTTGSDFWDMWNAIIDSLEAYKIVDDVFNP